MSLPAAMASGPVMAAVASINPIDAFLQLFNSNPYFIGIMMLILNLGGRFISLEVTKKQELFLQRPWVRRLLIFTVLFVATRSIQVAFWTTVAVVLVLGYLFNENSALCIFGVGGTKGAKCSDKPKDGEGMTPEEKEILQRLSAKAQRYAVADGSATAGGSLNPQQAAMRQSMGAPEDDDDVLHTDVYAANLTLLKK